MFTVEQMTEEQAVTVMETIGDSEMPGLFEDGKLIAVFVDYDYTFASERKARHLARKLNDNA